MLRVRRCFGVLLVLSALLTVLMMPLASPASLLDLAPQGQKSSAEEGRQDFTLEGKFELAKVAFW
ncbi:MAG: mechanosensitive ion channel protein, partial [Cyanobacteria bacterium]|nr:mechanosensitive ion channel protein [Cyanobacteriota bacterium]